MKLLKLLKWMLIIETAEIEADYRRRAWPARGRDGVKGSYFVFFCILLCKHHEKTRISEKKIAPGRRRAEPCWLFVEKHGAASRGWPEHPQPR